MKRDIILSIMSIVLIFTLVQTPSYTIDVGDQIYFIDGDVATVDQMDMNFDLLIIEDPLCFNDFESAIANSLAMIISDNKEKGKRLVFLRHETKSTNDVIRPHNRIEEFEVIGIGYNC